MRPEASLQATPGFQSAQGPSHFSPCSLNNITVATHIHACTCKPTCEHLCTYTHMYIRVHVHTYTHTHILRPMAKVESTRPISSPCQPLPDASLDHIQRECLPRWPAVSEPPFDLEEHFSEVVSFTAESHLSFRTCKLTCFEWQSFRER